VNCADAQAIRDRLSKLKERANLQASAHAVLRDHYALWNYWLTIGALIPTAALLLFPLVTDDFIVSALHMSPAAFKLLNAAVALFAFVAVLIQMVWRPDSLSKAHRRAVEHYTAAKFDTRRLLEASNIVPSDAKILEQTYLEVRGLPDIPEGKFLRLKQRHLQKVALSAELDKNPWLHLPSLFRRSKS
jgi:hypothetical protein